MVHGPGFKDMPDQKQNGLCLTVFREQEAAFSPAARNKKNARRQAYEGFISL